LWESTAIDTYLAETFGLVPSSPFERAEVMSIIYSLYEMRDKISATAALPSAEERAKAHHNYVTDLIPNHLKLHEAIIEKSGGPYYQGNKVSVSGFVDFF
jgi:glutathione S-transferase